MKGKPEWKREEKRSSVSGVKKETQVLCGGFCGSALACRAAIRKITRTMPAKKSAPKPAAHWLVKSEPNSYAWADLVSDGRTAWTGVRNYAARLHLSAMRPGDHVLFYESVTTKAVMGVAEITRAAFPDTTAEEAGWVAVELRAVQTLRTPVALAQIKSEPTLANIMLVRQGRLSVMPLAPAEFARMVALGDGE